MEPALDARSRASTGLWVLEVLGKGFEAMVDGDVKYDPWTETVTVLVAI